MHEYHDLDPVSSSAMRRRSIAAAVEEFVEPGDAWLVRGDGDGVQVTTADERRSIADAYPDLYGRMLQINEALSDTGGWLVLIGNLLVAGGCVAIHMEWLDDLVGPGIAKVRSVWVYVLAIISSVFGSGMLATAMEAGVYARHRFGLLGAIDAAGLTPHAVLARIEGNESLKNLAQRMKKDPSLE